MPFETVAIDFITKLLISQGYDSILTVTDHDCSKVMIFIPCNEEISGEGTAALYAKNIFTGGLDYPPKSSVTVTHDLCQNSHGNYARYWVSTRTSQWCITHIWTDNPNTLTSG
jgi:hypothetical protein